MTPEEIIKNAIDKAEKIQFPHIFTDEEKILNIYSVFLKTYNKMKKSLLKKSNIDKIVKKENSETIYSFSEYIDSTRSMFSKIKVFFMLLPDNYKKGEDKDIYNTLNLFQDIGLQFIKKLESNLDSLNFKKEHLNSKKETISKIIQYDFVNLETCVLGEKFKIFSAITKTKNLIVAGQPSLDYINKWLETFNTNAKITMNNIGFHVNDITLNNRITYYLDNSVRLGDSAAHIYYENNNNNYKITFHASNHNVSSLILHEWFHALDLEVGYKINKKNKNFISNSFLFDNLNITEDNSFYPTYMKCKDMIAQIYFNSNFETYKIKNQEKIKNYKYDVAEIIGQVICPDINNDWKKLSKKDKDKILSLPDILSIIPLCLSYQSSDDQNFIKNVGKKINNVISSDIFNEIFPDQKYTTPLQRLKMLKERVNLYSLEHNIVWTHLSTSSKNHSSENGYTLVDSTFSKFSYFSSLYNKDDYIFVPFEMMARKAQSLCYKYECYDVNIKTENESTDQYLLREFDSMRNISFYPETSPSERVIIVETIQEMGKFLGLKPLVKPSEVPSISLNQPIDDTRQIEVNISERGLMEKRNSFISSYKRQTLINIKKLQEEITKKEETKNLKCKKSMI